METEYKELLLNQINRKREEMISVANSTGFTSEETIECSQELDELINIYQRYETVSQNNTLFRQYIKRVMLFFMLQKVSYKPAKTQ
ncbi:aspartyl-phosphate phosphatase Spo0E family protein [Fredinandcohnia sp. 179-A 10B2 NHS]|uniref:aspartyl-phosphate phosphatase Spo0E family protein n=1 Tax=Fredinandcohnia sp. 179-A 10B2 NHS TaxID=3235176 RepID=UPI00399F77C2